MLSLSPPRRAASWCALVVGALVLTGALFAEAEKSPSDDDAAEPEIEDVTVLPELEVKGARVEEFGFRFNVTVRIPGTDTIYVTEVWPNSAASKAGLRPGDQILKIDGKRASALSMGLRPNKIQERKWAQLAAGKPSVTLELQVRTVGTKEPRTVTLVLPSATPRWGGMPWTPPEGRPPAVVLEPGPLAALAREVLEQGIWSMGGMKTIDGKPVLTLGYEWRIVTPTGLHRFGVTQQNGKTEILLESRSPVTGDCGFVTSPSGAMDHASGGTPKKKGEKRRALTEDELRVRFAAELDFWLHHVRRSTGRWPFETLPDATGPGVTSSAVADPGAAATAIRTEAFLQLRVATEEQRALFLEAFAKLGNDDEGWAYTETVRGLNDVGSTTARIDPSLPPPANITLLQVNGKKPKDRDREKWQQEGRTALPGLAELPPLSSLVDVNDVRVVADEAAAVVFELPMLTTNTEFPAEKFQARFRVNKTHHGFEDFSIQLREKLGVAGVATVTDAGLEARFQVLDPKLAPYPVHLRIGGGVRVVLVKISRAVEIDRTDFKRVVPLEEQAK